VHRWKYFKESRLHIHGPFFSKNGHNIANSVSFSTLFNWPPCMGDRENLNTHTGHHGLALCLEQFK
jgi:hypothetical protein